MPAAPNRNIVITTDGEQTIDETLTRPPSARELRMFWGSAPAARWDWRRGIPHPQRRCRPEERSQSINSFVINAECEPYHLRLPHHAGKDRPAAECGAHFCAICRRCAVTGIENNKALPLRKIATPRRRAASWRCWSNPATPRGAEKRHRLRGHRP